MEAQSPALQKRTVRRIGVFLHFLLLEAPVAMRRLLGAPEYSAAGSRVAGHTGQSGPKTGFGKHGTLCYPTPGFKADCRIHVIASGSPSIFSPGRCGVSLRMRRIGLDAFFARAQGRGPDPVRESFIRDSCQRGD